MALPGKKRLTITKDLMRSFRKGGRRITTVFLGAFYRKTEEALRCGIVVGAKVSKKATARNRLRRRVQQAISDSANSLTGELIIYPKREMLELDTKRIQEEVVSLFKNIREMTD